MPFVNALTECQTQNTRLFRLLLVSAGLMAYSFWGWHNAGKELTAHFPPDLRNGATIRMSQAPEVPAHVAYAFGHMIWQKINRWDNDGSKDYGAQIYSLQDYLTPACRDQLISDMNIRSKSGELQRRTRTLEEIQGMTFAPERVIVQGNGAWQVMLDAQIRETVNGMAVKSAYLRYPLRIVRFDVERDKNPWGLAVDCYGPDRPARLDPKAVSVAQAAQTMVPNSAIQAPPQAVNRMPSAAELAAEGAAAAAPAVSAAGASAPKAAIPDPYNDGGMRAPTVLPAPAN